MSGNITPEEFLGWGREDDNDLGNERPQQVDAPYATWQSLISDDQWAYYLLTPAELYDKLIENPNGLKPNLGREQFIEKEEGNRAKDRRDFERAGKILFYTEGPFEGSKADGNLLGGETTRVMAFGRMVSVSGLEKEAVLKLANDVAVKPVYSPEGSLQAIATAFGKVVGGEGRGSSWGKKMEYYPR
ncbi:MAG TPA: hypothetical protein VG917_01710 [Patescibacteria group bacterium]|nr:hypothetical protein [Patescibacteria group bacterium]